MTYYFAGMDALLSELLRFSPGTSRQYGLFAQVTSCGGACRATEMIYGSRGYDAPDNMALM